MKDRNCLANPPSLYFNEPLQVTVEQFVAPAPQEHWAKEALESSGARNWTKKTAPILHSQFPRHI